VAAVLGVASCQVGMLSARAGSVVVQFEILQPAAGGAPPPSPRALAAQVLTF
jgi:hypothetical protein